MKTAFITGASSGIGKATAKLFQSKGWSVIATMRDPGKETDLRDLDNVTLLPLDVTNLEQIRSAATEAISISNIDVVVNGNSIHQTIEICAELLGEKYIALAPGSVKFGSVDKAML